MNTITKLVLASAVFAGVGTTQAALVSDFNTPASIAAFTRYTILDGDANKDSSLSAPSGALLATKGTAATPTNPEQSAFTQNFTVNVGDTLRADYAFGSATAPGTSVPYADFGIFLGAQPTDLVYSGTGNQGTRANYVAVYANSQTGDVKTVGADGTTVSSSFVVASSGITAKGLYITRTAANVFSVGYVNASGVDTFMKSYTIASAVPFTQVGVFTDLRGTGTTVSSLDNLQVVPEPASMALLGSGGLICLRRRRA